MILEEEQLLHWTGFEQPGRLKSWLIEKEIPYFAGCGGRICTTTEAVNEALKDHSDLFNNRGRGHFEKKAG